MNREKLYDAFTEYESIFNDIFPRSALSGLSDKETLKVIKRCIEEKKDVYDLGYLQLDNNIQL